jgi:molybdopterin-biosynthesis enzyme MoeA-like protein
MTDKSNKTSGVGLIIIGDEILSGKRADKHFTKVVSLLNERGMTLNWVQYLGDDRNRCINVLKQTFASTDVVFSCGGIGATPDDHTRQSAAAALGVPLVLHPQAAQLIQARVAQVAAESKTVVDMARPENQQRLRMGEFPQGANIIANPYNLIPGFNIAHHWFVPGFPVMAWPMIEAVLDTHYKHLHHQTAHAEKSMFVFDIGEADATPLMERVEADFPNVRVYSLPSVGENGARRHIELGVKGDPSVLAGAFDALRKGVIAIGATVSTESPAN